MANNFSSKFIELYDPYLHQPHQKSFKILLSLFNKNLETLHKIHKKAIFEFQQPLKVRIKKQDELFLESHFKRVYEENVHKIIKENLERNANIFSIMNAYYIQYYQRKTQDSKFIYPCQQTIQSIEQPDLRISLTQKKGRSKTFSNRCVLTQSKTKTSNEKDQRNIKTIADINDSAFCQNSERKIIFYKRNYTNLKNRQRNYSFHSETIDSTNERIQNSENQMYEQQKTARDRTQTTPQQRATKDHFNETFRPFYGLNTKDIFVKKPNIKVNSPQQSSTLSDLKINFASRSAIRGRLASKKVGNNQFFGTFFQKNNVKYLRGDQQSKNFMRQDFLKVSSDLAIKNVEPQGYKGKSRIRYRSLQEDK